MKYINDFKMDRLFHNVSLLFVIISLIFIVAGGIYYPWAGSAPIIVRDPAPFKSLIPSRQSGTVMFSIPLPMNEWELPVNIVCSISNLTKMGVCQNVPVLMNVTITLQNFAAQGAMADKYIYISSFNVEPVNVIEADYVPIWDNETSILSYHLRDPAEFAELWCTPKVLPEYSGHNSLYETFSCSSEVILQDSGLIYLNIKPTIFPKNPTDTVWVNSIMEYVHFSKTISIPISVMSSLDANREIIQVQQQNLEYLFNVIQLQQAEDQRTEDARSTSTNRFIIGLTFVNIAIAIASLRSEEKKPREKESIEYIWDYAVV